MFSIIRGGKYKRQSRRLFVNFAAVMKSRTVVQAARIFDSTISMSGLQIRIMPIERVERELQTL